MAVTIVAIVVVLILASMGVQTYTWAGVAVGLLLVVAGTVLATWLVTRYWKT